MFKKICYLLTMFTLFFGFNLLVSAKDINHTIDFSSKGKIKITLHEEIYDSYIENAEITIYHIADVVEGVNLTYSLREELLDCEINLDDLTDPELVKEISKCNIDNAVKYTDVTDKNGVVKFNNLDLGLYYIVQTESVEGYSEFEPFLVAIPIIENKQWNYEIEANPKTDIYKLIDIVIKKEWNSHNNNIPNKVEIELYNDNELIESIILNEENNWTYTFKNLRLSDKYNVKEVNVPKGYTPSYKVNDYVFTVTNTDTLADTGQIFYPIIISFILGVILVLLGIRIIRNEA